MFKYCSSTLVVIYDMPELPNHSSVNQLVALLEFLFRGANDPKRSKKLLVDETIKLYVTKQKGNKST